jgi:uncharacterized repeat protein (TIGR03803 family)
MRLSKSGFVFGILTFAIVTLSTYGQAFAVSEKILWSFGSGVDGYEPVAGLIKDSRGNFYGTTEGGGAHDGDGTVFELTALGKESVLHNFCSLSTCADGAKPVAGLLLDETSGNLYGTTNLGGTYGDGTVFQLTPPSIPGGIWGESTIWSFGNPKLTYIDGTGPAAGLIMDGGNLYGTTGRGGPYNANAGTVFELTSPSISGGNWTESILYNFMGSPDGGVPTGLIMGSGNLYGTTI